MNPYLRFFIGLTIAWLLGLLLMMVAMFRQRRNTTGEVSVVGPAENRLRTWLYAVGKYGAQTAIGLAFVTIVVVLVTSLLPPPPNVTRNAQRIQAIYESVLSNTARVDTIMRWMAKHDSLHRKIP